MTELDPLATALYVKTDDLLKASPHLAPWRPAVGIAPQLTDAELVTLAMMQPMLGFTSEARWLRHARSHLRHLFPYLPKQPGYNKRLRKAAELLRRVTRLLATDTSVRSDDVWIVDSTPVECGRSGETAAPPDTLYDPDTDSVVRAELEAAAAAAAARTRSTDVRWPWGQPVDRGPLSLRRRCPARRRSTARRTGRGTAGSRRGRTPGTGRGRPRRRRPQRGGGHSPPRSVPWSPAYRCRG